MTIRVLRAQHAHALKMVRARVNDDNGQSIENRTGMGMKLAGQLPWDA